MLWLDATLVFYLVFCQLAALRANMAQTRQSRPDFGLVLQLNVLEAFELVPYYAGRSAELWLDATLFFYPILYEQIFELESF